MGQNNGKKFYPVSPTKIRNCVWIKLADRAKTPSDDKTTTRFMV